ncbi:hypothetical protein ADL22_24790 [Streptomyces sp. NRRL F-4489]|uniref:(2Fe-2S)-binding protein n=1 Tax=Streptomyces sp. NRRL F-4489 TaxID=1609095 RepID=UPI0007473122|nr:(2Fe-2S)-binding protein [Streptomyces sp. NRRL F-4489]KUL36363.1 hypothetical protein ADL22_24790 [Streptomyces sp. NRRL F-4489]
MSDADNRRPQQPHPEQGWQPLPQGGEYESEATAFVQLPEGFTTGAYGAGYGTPGADPLAAPGHGYTPPASFPAHPAPPVPGAATDPAATGHWTMPFAGPNDGYADPAAGYGAHGGPGGHGDHGGQHGAVGAHQDPHQGGAHQGAHQDMPHQDVPHQGGHHQGAPHQDASGYQANAPEGGRPWGGEQVHWPVAGSPEAAAGAWAVPAADDVLEESGEYLVGDDRLPGHGGASIYADGGYPAPAYEGGAPASGPGEAGATGHWNFTAGLDATGGNAGAVGAHGAVGADGAAGLAGTAADPGVGAGPEGHGGAAEEPYHQAPADDPYGHGAGAHDAGTGAATGHWSLPADALAQWPPAAPETAHGTGQEVPAPGGADTWSVPVVEGEHPDLTGQFAADAFTGGGGQGAAGDGTEAAAAGAVPEAGVPDAGARVAETGAAVDAGAPGEHEPAAPAEHPAPAAEHPAPAAHPAPAPSEAETAVDAGAGPDAYAEAGAAGGAHTPGDQQAYDQHVPDQHVSGEPYAPEGLSGAEAGAEPGTEGPSGDREPAEAVSASGTSPEAPQAPHADRPEEPGTPGPAPAAEPGTAPATAGTDPGTGTGTDPGPAPGAPAAPAATEEPAPSSGATPPGPAPEATPEADPAPAVPDSHDEHPSASYVLRVNGADRPVTDAWIGESLLYVLRERLGLAGAKDGCSQGECGACSVQVDGRLVASCLVPAATAAGSEVRTVEGLARDGVPSDVQRALAASGAVQCGFCVPGMAMTVHDLLEGNHAPTELETRKALCGNLCRCSGYRGVLDAVAEVVRSRSEAAGQDTAGPDAAGEPDGTARIPHQAGPADPVDGAPHNQDAQPGGTG